MSYKETLNLPVTRFPMRAKLPEREPQWLECWEKADLYGQLMSRRKDAEPFILHDGPPFANGDAHMGHALNMALKDIVLKSRNMSGKYVPFIPGWDCHGLPIEHKVMKELNDKKEQGARDLDPVEIREKCAAMANKYIDVQRTQFKRMGVFGEWDRPYITMEGPYEADVLRVFARIVEKGMVFQALKPVYWSTGCQTALAEAEVEYMDRHDTSVYVAFPMTEASSDQLGLADASMVIWTTTPWTLPANLAVAAHASLQYVAVESDGNTVILAEARLEAFEKITGRTWKVMKQFSRATSSGWNIVTPSSNEPVKYSMLIL
jgi:isoleucyl-tRNA synthetase